MAHATSLLDRVYVFLKGFWQPDCWGSAKQSSDSVCVRLSLADITIQKEDNGFLQVLAILREIRAMNTFFTITNGTPG